MLVAKVLLIYSFSSWDYFTLFPKACGASQLSPSYWN